MRRLGCCFVGMVFLNFQSIQSKHEKTIRQKMGEISRQAWLCAILEEIGTRNYSEINEAFAMPQISQRSSLLFLIAFSILTDYFRPKS